MHNLNEKLRRYMNAGFPLLYITSFEEEKCDRVISEAAEGRAIIEWSEATGDSGARGICALGADCAGVPDSKGVP